MACVTGILVDAHFPKTAISPSNGESTPKSRLWPNLLNLEDLVNLYHIDYQRNTDLLKF